MPITDDPIFVAPGTVEVTVSKQGHEPTTLKISVDKAERKQVSVELKLLEGDPVILPPPEEKPVWPYVVLGGVTAAGLGVGIGLHVASASRIDDADGFLCPGGAETCPAEARDAESAANAMLGGAIAGYAVAGLGLAGLIGYIAWAGPDQTETALRVVPVVSPTGSGLFLQSTF